MKRKLPRRQAALLAVLGLLILVCLVAGAALLLRPAPVQPEPTARYLLKDDAGYLALYSGDGAGPLARYDIYTRLLPEQDVLALQSGVPVQDEAELQRLLEDYGL